LHIQPKENVIVECWDHGLDVAREIIYQLRAVGARPMFLFEDEETYWRSVETLPATKLGHVAASEWAALSKTDAYIFVPGPADLPRYRKNLPKSAAAAGYNSDWYRRAKKASLRGARLLLGYATRERAVSYGFDLDAWRAMLVEASSGDFLTISRKSKKVASLLSGEGEVSISAPNGTRLAFSLKGRKAHLEDGIVDAEDREAGDFMANVPPGQAFVAPDEASAEGVLVADLPLPYLGTLVRGVQVAFKDGKATWKAGENESALRPSWEKATGPKDRLAALGIGLNPAVRTGFLQDDLAAGVLEIGIGDNTEFGGRNRTSFYLGARLSGATVSVGKKVVVDRGRLMA
jgi:leucyl aminopeptidase (aminopeptidase T)